MKKATTLAAALLCAAVSFGELSTLTPKVLKASWADGWWMPRHQSKVAEAAKKAPKVVFIGDSITHHWDTCATAQRDKYFSKGDLKMLNLGFEGDRTQNVLWRLTEGKELDGFEAKVVFLMIGTNNAGWGKEPPIDTIAGIREIIRVIREKQPKAKLVLTAIFPRGKDGNDFCRKYNATVNREIVKFADGKDIVWLDFNDRFLNADGTLPQKMFPDFLHPTGDGYEIWAEEALPYAKAALAGKPMPKPKKGSSSAKAGAADAPLAAQAVSRIGCEGSGAKDWWLDRAIASRRQIVESKGEIDLVFLGDSAAYGWEKQGKDSLAELRKTYSVVNIGYADDSTQNVLWRVQNGELDHYTAKCILLAVGTDSVRNGKDKPEEVASGIRQILDVIAKKQPKTTTLLLSVLPVGNGPKSASRVHGEKVNDIIKGYADGKKVIWVDFTNNLLDAKGDNLMWMPDRGHLSAVGYREICMPVVLPLFKGILDLSGDGVPMSK